jgi:hypothetical protein
MVIRIYGEQKRDLNLTDNLCSQFFSGVFEVTKLKVAEAFDRLKVFSYNHISS